MYILLCRASCQLIRANIWCLGVCVLFYTADSFAPADDNVDCKLPFGILEYYSIYVVEREKKHVETRCAVARIALSGRVGELWVVVV